MGATTWRGSSDFQQCGPNQPDHRTQTVPWSRVRRAWRSHSSSRQEDSRWPELRKAPSSASKAAGTMTEKIPQTRTRRSRSAWRPQSARRRCSKLKNTADGQFLPKGSTSPDRTSRNSIQSIFSKTAEPGLCMCWLGWTGQNFDRSDGSAIPRRIHFCAISFAGISTARSVAGLAPEDANNILAYWNNKQKAQATRGAVMVLATLWTTRRDTQKLEICSAQLRRDIIPQSWDCTMDHCDVCGSPSQVAGTYLTPA